jgi:hypothetical protein
MSRNFVEGIKVRIATKEEILDMAERGFVNIHGCDEDCIEVQGKNSSSLTILISEMGKVGTFKKIDSDGDAIVVLGDVGEYYFPEELLTIIKDGNEKTKEEKEVEKSDKKLIRFENVEPYFKLSDEQIKLLYVLYEYGLLNESFNFADEVEIIEI